MSYIEEITKVLDAIEIEPAIFKVEVSKSYISLQRPDVKYKLDLDTFYGSLLDSTGIIKNFSSIEKEFQIDYESTCVQALNDVLYGIRYVFNKCSPAKEVRRTKAYKIFNSILSDNRNNEEFITNIFNIYEYYLHSTKEYTITNNINDVHRKNIFQLLCLMEKKYGKKNNNK